jgi:hypothetical protein
MDVPSNVQVWKELYRFSQEREELNLKSVKLGGKRLKEEDFAHYASLASTSVTGKMSLNAVAPLVIPENDTVVRAVELETKYRVQIIPRLSFRPANRQHVPLSSTILSLLIRIIRRLHEYKQAY